MPVLANIELIWVIIVIISVIAQIRKGMKKATGQPGKPTPGGQDAAPEREPYVAPDEALREFLESLAGKPSRTEPPATPRPAVAPQPAVVQRPRRHPARRMPSAPPAAPMPPPPPQRQAKETVSEPVALEMIHDDATHRDTEPLAMMIRQGLKSRQSARTAIVMREILGPPLALR